MTMTNNVTPLGDTKYGTVEAVVRDLEAAAVAYWLPTGPYPYIFFADKINNPIAVAMLRAIVVGEFARIHAVQPSLKALELEMNIEVSPSGCVDISTIVSQRVPSKKK